MMRKTVEISTMATMIPVLRPEDRDEDGICGGRSPGARGWMGTM